MHFEHLWRDPVILVLLLASVVSWVLIIDRVIVLTVGARADRALLAGAVSPASPLAACRMLLQQHAGVGREQLAVILDTEIVRQRQRLEGLLPLLGAIGSTAPYIGLLGTVVGIIRAFQAIQAANTMTPSVVSGGIAAALVATAAGLTVAIPAVMAHHLIMAAIARRVATWEAALATWLPEDFTHEPVATAPR